MPNLSIKDVPEAWAEALRQRAARNHRSLQGELLALVEQAVTPAAATGHSWHDASVSTAPQENDGGQNPSGGRVVGYDSSGYPIIRSGWKTVEQVVADLRAKYPEPIVDQLSSIDIIRQDRDSR